MENASKALVMAGGVLLALMILAVFLFIWQGLSDYSKQSDEQKKMEQVMTFNKEYESYQRQILRGADIVTIMNKVDDNNKRYPYKIEWEMKIPVDLTYDDSKESGNSDKLLISRGIYKNSSFWNTLNNAGKKEFRRLYFRCTSVLYDNIENRVNKITFEQYDSKVLFPGG